MTIAQLKGILVPSDKLEMDDKCLTIQMRSHRRELLQAYIRRVSPEVEVSFSSAEIRREACKLKVEKEKILQKENTSFNAGVVVGAIQENTQHTQKDSMQIQTLGAFELAVNQDVIKGNCRFITPERYEITLEVRKDPVPLYPTLPPGTIITNAPMPPDQETSLLQTTLQLNKGNRIEIGSVVKDLRDQQQKIDIKPQVEIEKTSGTSTEKVFLGLQ